jgi:hypothetical protein
MRIKITLAIAFGALASLLAASTVTADEAVNLLPNKVEQIDQRTRDSKTFHLGGIQYETVFAEALHYKDSNGDWADTVLEFQAGNGEWEMKTHPFYHATVGATTVTMTHPTGTEGIRWRTPALLSVGDNYASYMDDGLEWVYKLTHRGVKLTAEVEAPRGPKLYSFAFTPIGGLEPFGIDPSGNAVSGYNKHLPSAGNLGAAAVSFVNEESDDVTEWLMQTPRIVVPRPVIIGADKEIYSAGRWIVQNGSLLFYFDDTGLPVGAYPYLIDPTSEFDIAANADDGLVYANPAGSYPPSCTAGNDSATSHDVLRGKSGSNYGIQIGVVRWDTSGIPDNVTVTAASLRLYIASTTDTDSRSAVMGWYVHDGSISCDDFNSTAGTDAHGGTAISSLSTGGNNTFALTNLTNVSLTSYTGMRINVSGSTPTGSNSFEFAALEHASYDPPRLAVTYVVPSAALSGTAQPNASELEIRNGGQTVILTLTGTTWAADGATFNAQRQNIIDGLDSAQSETYGWNNEVRDKIPVTDVIRTSDTVVTITLSAASAYAITSTETITATIPASATAASGAITASPTFEVAPGSESLAITGTLGDNATAAEIRSGGQTLLLTLTNATWVASGGTFDAQRQNIINGIDSAQSDQNGWDTQRANLPVTDVVRSSDTLVTITLSALADYAIPAIETLTAVAPASTMNYPTDLTGSPTFTITPSFVSSGTWTSAAINLSAITDLAYCAVGWSSTVPANTTLSMEYSSDGGTTYTPLSSSGACPFTENTSLSTISDFRIRATLTSTDATITPSLTALGVVAGDTTGQTVRYQLNTTPALTIDDRTGNGHSATMSFPSHPSGVSSTVGSMTALRSAPAAQQVKLGIPQITSPVTGTAVSDNLFNLDETGWAELPGYSIVNTMATAGDGLPIRFVWYLMLGFLTIMLGFWILNLTQSLFAAGGAMALGIGAALAIGGGLMPGWVIFVFIPVALGIILFRKGLPI